MYQVWSTLKDVDYRVFTRMLRKDPLQTKFELTWSGRIRSASSNHDCTFNTQNSNHDCTFSTRTVVTMLISYFNFHSFQNMMN
jgi:hypothetical protein